MTDIERKDDLLEELVLEGLASGAETARVLRLRLDRELGTALGALARVKIVSIVKVLSARNLYPTKKQIIRVATCTDLDTLDRWFDRSLTVVDADEIFED